MNSPTSNPKRPKMTLTQWGICAIACIGFLFDTFVLLVLTLVVQPALVELLGTKPGSEIFNHWVGMLFYVPAVAGGIFGLLGGYLIDRLGRRRVLLWSIVLPAFATLATAFARTPLQLLVLRSLTFVGVSVEFVASTAWLAELFPIRERREAILGYTQGFSSLGGIVMSGAYYIAVTYSQHFPMVYGGHQAWRYTLMLGILPAIPVIFILPFLPESPIWLQKKTEGTLKRPSVLELFHPRFRKTALLTCLMMACAYAASFGMLQHFARIIPGTPGVRMLAHAAQQQQVGKLQGAQEFGGLLGRFLMAFLAVYLLSRRKLLRIFQVPGLLLIPLVVILPAVRDTDMSTLGIFLLGLGQRGPVQLLGELPASGLSGAPAGHRRKLCGEYRRAHAGHFRSTDHHKPRFLHAGRHRGEAIGLCGRDRGISGVRDRLYRQLLAARAGARRRRRLRIDTRRIGALHKGFFEVSMFLRLAGGLGLEPRLAESESAVLPIAPSPTRCSPPNITYSECCFPAR